jgi:hypothetical protein
MFRPGLFARGACISAFVLLAAAPAIAGDDERAERAIAKAGAKIDAANKVGASGEVPGMVARAQSTLAQAKEDLKRGHERLSFDEATEAARLADTALGTAQQNQIAAERDQRNSAEAAASMAQRDAADANARAANAEQAAATAAADAAAARATPPPAPVATTVVVEKSSKTVAPPKRVVTRAPVKKRTTTTVRRATPATVATEESTTTVTTNASGQ